MYGRGGAPERVGGRHKSRVGKKMRKGRRETDREEEGGRAFAVTHTAAQTGRVIRTTPSPPLSPCFVCPGKKSATYYTRSFPSQYRRRLLALCNKVQWYPFIVEGGKEEGSIFMTSSNIPLLCFPPFPPLFSGNLETPRWKGGKRQKEPSFFLGQC